MICKTTPLIIVDQEIKQIVKTAYTRAEDLLKTHEDELHTLAKALLEYEMLSGDEITALLKGDPIIRDYPDDEDDAKPKSSVPSSGTGLKPDGDEMPQGV